MYSYLTRFKNVAFHAKFFYAIRRRGPHHVVCLRAPTILDPPLGILLCYEGGGGTVVSVYSFCILYVLLFDDFLQ